MTGTGRRRWMVVVGVLVVVAIGAAGWLLRGDGDEDDGTDTTPPTELAWVGRLTDLSGVVAADRSSPMATGRALGDVIAALRTPQDLEAFTAAHGIGPLDMASQLATALAGIEADVSPPSACGTRARSMRGADTRLVLELVASAMTVIERNQDPAAVAALILPVGIDGDRRQAFAEQLAAGDIEPAAEAVADELGDDSARHTVHALVEEIVDVVNATDDADYQSSFLSTYNFAASVNSAGCD